MSLQGDQGVSSTRRGGSNIASLYSLYSMGKTLPVF